MLSPWMLGADNHTYITFDNLDILIYCILTPIPVQYVSKMIYNANNKLICCMYILTTNNKTFYFYVGYMILYTATASRSRCLRFASLQNASYTQALFHRMYMTLLDSEECF